MLPQTAPAFVRILAVVQAGFSVAIDTLGTRASIKKIMTIDFKKSIGIFQIVSNHLIFIGINPQTLVVKLSKRVNEYLELLKQQHLRKTTGITLPLPSKMAMACQFEDVGDELLPENHDSHGNLPLLT
jgi:hypothetical protein